MEWYLGVIRKYAEFTGRARRQEYWMFVLINMLISAAIGIVERSVGLATDAGAGGPLSGLYGLFVLIPGIAVAVRRLHDTGRSGWYLLVGLIPLIGWIFVIIWLATDGQPSTNEYGPSPKYGVAPQMAPGYAPAGTPAQPPTGAPIAPGPAQPPIQATAPAGWIADPTGRHELRYWDGAAWTEHVSDAGVQGTDALT